MTSNKHDENKWDLSFSLHSSSEPSPESSRQKPIRRGDAVAVRYFDHVLYRDSDLTIMKPTVREAIGWLEDQNDDFIRLVWERYAEPSISENSRIRSTGIALRKCDVIEIARIG